MRKIAFVVLLGACGPQIRHGRPVEPEPLTTVPAEDCALLYEQGLKDMLDFCGKFPAECRR